MVPSALTTTAPCGGSVATVTIGASTTPVSLARTLMTLAPLSSATVTVSLTAIGLSLTGVTVTVTVATAS